jgi:hypothetical protein
MTVASLVIGLVAAVAAVAAAVIAWRALHVGVRSEQSAGRYVAREQLREVFEYAERIRRAAPGSPGPGVVFHHADQDNLRRALAGVEVSLPACRDLCEVRESGNALVLANLAVAEIEKALANLDTRTA